MNTTQSEKLYQTAMEYMPGGVNSPVRAFGSVGRSPLFITSASGDRITDADGNTYIDYVCSWGPDILGHAHPSVISAVKAQCENGLTFGACHASEIELASVIRSHMPSMELIRLVSSGTEAVMSAVRAARGYTGRDLIVKFEGCYHGHSDGLLVKGGSGLLTGSIPNSAGVPRGFTDCTLVAAYNDPDSVEALFAQHLGIGGAQGVWGITPDLTALGKIVGGGMPLAAYGGRREIMECVAPLGSVYQAGTLSGNPIAVAAGLATLLELEKHPELYSELDTKTARLADAARTAGMQVNRCGSLMTVFFTDAEVTDHAGAMSSDTGAYAAYFNYLLENGVYTAPSQFEAMFVSAAHTDADIDRTCDLIRSYA